MLDPVPILLVAFAMAVLFAATVAGKLADPQAFRTVLHGYRLIPERWLTPAAGLVMAAEGAMAAAWLMPPARPIAAWGSALLLLVYAAAIGSNLLRGRTELDCGCSFGTGGRVSWWLVARNALLAAVALIAVVPAMPRALTAADYAVAATATVAAIALYLAAQQLIGNAAAFAARRNPGGGG